MGSTKTKKRAMLAVDRPLWERVRKEAQRQGRKVQVVSDMIIVRGLESVENDPALRSPSMTGS